MQAPIARTDDAVKTTCAYCGVGCGVIAKTADDHISISGDMTHPANFGRLCSKGSALGETIDLNDRLLQPKINNHEVNWDTALQTVADKLTQAIHKHGPESVAFYVSGQLLTEDYYVANKLMKGFIGSANIDTNSRLCMSSAVTGHKRAFGSDSVALCYEDLEQTDVIVLIGSNIAWCHPVLYQRIEQARQKNAVKLVVIDPRRTASCDGADMHLPIKPGTDVCLFNGLLVYLADRDLIDHAYLDSYTHGFAATLEVARSNAPNIETVAQVCDVDAMLISRLYELYANNTRLISFFSQGINQSSSGVDKVNAIINVHLATGKIGQPGVGAFSITGQPNAMGGREVGGLANTLAAHMDFDATSTDRVQRFWQSPVIADKPGLKAVDLFKAVDAGKIKAIWIMATNPAVSLPDADRVQTAMDKCEFVVVSDCIEHTDTSRYADVLLPAQAWGEKSGTVTNSERRISRQRSFLQAAGEARPDWWIMAEVAKRMGYKDAFNYNTAADIFREHAALSGFENDESRDFDLSGMMKLSDHDYDTLQPIQWPVNKTYPQGCERLFTDGRFYTDDRKARLIPVQGRLPVELSNQDYPLILNTGRVRDHWHTMTRTAKSPRLSRHIREPFIQCHPDTAKQFNIEQDALVEVSSAYGSALIRADVTERQRPNEVFVPIHWNDQFSVRARIGAVVNPYVDALSGQPEFKHTPVNIRPVQHQWFGFLLSRAEVSLDSVAYWSKLREQNNWRYEFSDTVEHDLNWIRTVLIHDHDYEWLDLVDEYNHSMRCFWFDANGLQGCLFTARHRHDLPARDWLSEQFNATQFDDSGRFRLLAGTSGADRPDPGPVVCSCFNVGKNTIVNCIREFSITDVGAIGDRLQAGTNCGSCKPEINTLITETACAVQ